MSKPLKIAIIAGEESGDILGAELLAAMRLKTSQSITAIGVGGAHLQAQGLQTLFNPDEIALMGLSAILKKLPRLIKLISQTSDYILAEKPDCVVIIDSPEFCQRVAKRVRAANPSIPIINYICPSVWAWRSSRAKAMAPYIDHILAILPFEPEILKSLNGPAASYVGHRLATDAALLAASQAQSDLERTRSEASPKSLLLLPGSRRSEVRRTMAHLGATLDILKSRGHSFQLLLPTVPHVESEVRSLSASWAQQPEITVDAQRKAEMFASADAALAASGTVTLELALAGVPTVAIYDFDIPARIVSRFLFKGWTASLPNLIADEPVVPEFYNDHIRPHMLARQLERILSPSAARNAQRQGFAKIRALMATEIPPSEKAADIVLSFATSKIQP